MKPIVPSLALVLLVAQTLAQPVLKGKVIDKHTRQPLEYAVVALGENGKKTITDQQGNFELTLKRTGDSVRASGDSIKISFVGYRSQAIKTGKAGHPILVEMEHGQIDLRAVTIFPLSNNASFHTLTGIDLDLRPVNSAQDLMRLVPGLFLVQHQGGGVGDHIFLRGFDGDHGS